MTATAAAVRSCASCNADFAAALLACPSCGTLVHAAALKSLAAAATRAEEARDVSTALAEWRRVLELLPVGAGQHARVLAKVQALSDQVTRGGGAVAAAPSAPRRKGWGKWLAGLGAAGLLLSKLKWVIIFVLAKGKVLLVGLTQAKTFLSMAIALGVYTSIWGWRFALGVILSIYVHEMGHVVALRRFGIAATAPMFIPGFGAFVRLKQQLATPGEDARVGLAGPIWGTAAAVAAWLLGLALDAPLLVAIAHFGAWVNLFNLLPIWQLDGGRGFAALSQGQRGTVAGVLWLLVLMALTKTDGILLFLAAAATFRAATGRGAAPPRGDRAVLATFIALVVGLTLLMLVTARPGGQ